VQTKRYPLFVFAGLGVLHLLTRLWHLTVLPIFNDEAIYLRMAQLARQGHWFVTFEFENRKPLFVWLLAWVHRLTADPLLAGRALSVALGLVTMLLLVWWTWRHFDLQTACLVGLAYLVAPFTLFHERLALYDTPAMLFAAGALVAGWRLAESDNRREWLVFGSMGGLGLINKEVAYFTLAYPPAAIAARWWGRQAVAWRRVALDTVFGWALAATILLAVLAWPMAHLGGGLVHSADYYLSFAQLAALPFARWAANLGTVTNWYVTYLGPGLAFVPVLYFAGALVRRHAWGLYVSLAWLAPAAAIVLVAQRFYSRYLLFTLPPMLLANAAAVYDLRAWFAQRRPKRSFRWVTPAAAALLLIWPLPLARQVLTDPATAALTPDDRRQYVEDWPSGYGTREIVAQLRAEVRHGPLTVFVAPFAGMVKDALVIYLAGVPGVDVQPADWLPTKPLLFFVASGQTIAVRREPFLRDGAPRELSPGEVSRAVFVLNAPQLKLADLLALNPEARLLYHVPRPGAKSLLAIFELPRPATDPAGGHDG
jgi:hypothetical protein